MTFVSLSGPLWTSLDGLLGRSHDNNQLCFFGFSGGSLACCRSWGGQIALGFFLHHKFSH